MTRNRRNLDTWVKDSVFEANCNIAKYLVFVALVEWSMTWAWNTPHRWPTIALRVVAWAGLIAVVALRLFLYYGVEREMQREGRTP